MKALVPALALALALPSAAYAQDYLGSWLGAENYGRQLERSQQGQNAANAAPIPVPPTSLTPRQAAIKAELHRLMIEHAKVVAPEYHKRVTRDGKASADAWLAKVAREYGRQDREIIRAKFGR